MDECLNYKLFYINYKMLNLFVYLCVCLCLHYCAKVVITTDFVFDVHIMISALQKYFYIYKPFISNKKLGENLRKNITQGEIYIYIYNYYINTFSR